MPAKKKSKVKDLKPKAVKSGKGGAVRGGSSSTGAGAGKVTFNPFSITRKIDSASPKFF